MNILEFFSSSDSSLIESPEHCKNNFENDLKSLHCSDYFDFQIIDMNDFDFKSPKYGDFDF